MEMFDASEENIKIVWERKREGKVVKVVMARLIKISQPRHGDIFYFPELLHVVKIFSFELFSGEMKINKLRDGDGKKESKNDIIA